MEAPIQYVHTSDGVDIAFWSIGEGPALVAMPSFPWSHLQEEWSIPEVAHWYGALGRGRRLVRYDGRGFGLSQRDMSVFDLDAHVRDLAAVVDRAGLERFDLYAGQHSGAPGIAYTVSNPERVAHLILWCSYADGVAYSNIPVIQATRQIMHHDWDFYTEAVARLLLGWTEPEAARRFATLVRASTTPEVAAAALAATLAVDVRPLLARVAVPTLVISRPKVRGASFEQSRLMAAAIPGARLALLDGDATAPYLGDVDAVLREIAGFISGSVPALPTAAPVPGALQTILFTDIEASTTLTSRLGDAAARDVMRRHEQMVREALRGHGGTEVKAMGDGFMASFPSAVAAVECAVRLQRSQAANNVAAAEPLRIRVGLDAGEPIAEDGDLFGTAVITAARIAAHAGAAEIWVSDVVRQLVRGKGLRFIDKGEVGLRGLDEPMRLHSVVWEDEEESPT